VTVTKDSNQKSPGHYAHDQDSGGLFLKPALLYHFAHKKARGLGMMAFMAPGWPGRRRFPQALPGACAMFPITVNLSQASY
jgi:hypothetical protein